MNSLMSMRTIASSVSKRYPASALQSSVLPTPVGPRNRKLPIGRFCSPSPARLRRTASATASTASGWPTTRFFRSASMWRSFCRSLSTSLLTGMPVQRLTTAAIASASTSSFTSVSPVARRFCRLSCAACCSASSALISPCRMRAAFSKLPTRCACSASNFFSSMRLAALLTRSRSFFSDCHCEVSRRSSSLRSAISFSARPSRSLLSASFSIFSASRSISSCISRRRTLSSALGMLSFSMRRRLAASSTRSMALSGRNRSLM